MREHRYPQVIGGIAAPTKAYFANRIDRICSAHAPQADRTAERRKLVTLKDAATYIIGLPKKESALPEWQAAIQVLMLCSRGGDSMMAKIDFMKALHRGSVREFRIDRKETHWGKRRLKRDQ